MISSTKPLIPYQTWYYLAHACAICSYYPCHDGIHPKPNKEVPVSCTVTVCGKLVDKGITQ